MRNIFLVLTETQFNRKYFWPIYSTCGRWKMLQWAVCLLCKREDLGFQIQRPYKSRTKQHWGDRQADPEMVAGRFSQISKLEV